MDVETFKKMLDSALNTAEFLAKLTETDVDDKAIDFLQNIADNPLAIEVAVKLFNYLMELRNRDQLTPAAFGHLMACINADEADTLEESCPSPVDDDDDDDEPSSEEDQE